MSELRVEVVEIKKVEKHPNADRLDVCYIEGWTCITQKGAYNVGDKAIYVPIDSLLSEKLEAHVFPPDSKITLSKHRVKTIKLRGAISQGILLHLEDLVDHGFLQAARRYNVGLDVANELGITKYEPPIKSTPQGGLKQVKKRDKHPLFQEYSDISNYKWYPNLFKEGEEVVILEKIHGSNFRATLAPYHANTWWKKVKKFFNLAPKYEFCYGSHRVQLQYKKAYNGFYDKNIYLEMVNKYNLESVLEPGQAIYGEVYGHGVQKGYAYGCEENERKLVIFDIKQDGIYLNHIHVKRFCDRNNLEHVPVEYIGPYQGKEHLCQYVEGKSTLCPAQKIREGIVIKPFIEEHCYMGRKILKYKSDHFLLLANTDDTQDDFH